MTRWRLLLTDIWCVTIRAFAGLFVLRKLFFDRHRLWIGRLLIVFVTTRARGDRHVRRQPAQRSRASNIDVASRAFEDVFAFAAFVRELCRDSFQAESDHESRSRLVTTGTIICRRLQILPMTIKARIVTVRHRLVRIGQRWIRGSNRQRRNC